MNRIEFGDCREIMRRWAAAGVRAQTCVTSPPYFGLRSYLPEDHPDKALEIGAELTPEQYVADMVDVFRAVREVLADDGTLWLNIGDSYASSGGQGAQKGAGRGRGADGQVTRSARYVGGEAKSKDLIGIPWMLAFALRADGWYLRQEIIWAKATSGSTREGSAMPESVRDRCAKSHETIFLLAKSGKTLIWQARDTGEWSKSPDHVETILAPTDEDPLARRPRWRGQDYFFDADAIKEPAHDWGKPRDRSHMRSGTTDPKLKHGGLSKVDHEMGNRRSVWRVNPTRYAGAHFATYPTALVEPCVLAGSRPGDIVLDPFMGSGTTAAVAIQLGRQYMGCELNPEYAALQNERIAAASAPTPKKRRSPRAKPLVASAPASSSRPAPPPQLEIFD